MNIESEIRHFKNLSAIEQSRFLARFLYELTLEARNFYGTGAEQPIDLARLRFINEIQHRVTRLIEQILIDDPARTNEEALLRLLLAPRSEKTIEALMYAAWTRAVQGVS